MKIYDGTNTANLGETSVYIGHNGINHKVKFQTASGGHTILLGCNDSQWLGYVKFLDIL